MKSEKQIFRADHVGSLLRPRNIKNYREKYFTNNMISKTELREIEDEEIINVIQMQEKLGFKAVTDGEFRRSWWHYDFIENLNGIELELRETGVQFSGTNLRPFFPIVTDKIDFPLDHPMIEHFKFVAKNTKVFDSESNLVGRVSNIFGPVSDPYLAIAPNKGMRITKIIGREVYQK